MGNGITQVTAVAGLNVNMVDVSEDLLSKSVSNLDKSIMKSFKKKIEKGELNQAAATVKKDEIMSRIKSFVSPEKASENADLIIEAVPENLPLKQKIFGAIEDVAPASCIFASNTSSLPIAEIAANLKRKDRFGGLHFFNPVALMKLLEVVKGPETSQETFDAMMAYGATIGKATVKCVDTPGFIVNRLLVPYLFEAIRLYERGDASKEDIDTAMKYGASYPMGPFELADLVGLDTCKFIVDGWASKYPGVDLFAQSPLLNRLVEEGKLGRKTGEGFYKY